MPEDGRSILTLPSPAARSPPPSNCLRCPPSSSATHARRLRHQGSARGLLARSVGALRCARRRPSASRQPHEEGIGFCLQTTGRGTVEIILNDGRTREPLGLRSRHVGGGQAAPPGRDRGRRPEDHHLRRGRRAVRWRRLPAVRLGALQPEPARARAGSPTVARSGPKPARRCASVQACGEKSERCASTIARCARPRRSGTTGQADSLNNPNNREVSMKITDIKTYPVWVGRRNQFIVKVETDEGHLRLGRSRACPAASWPWSARSSTTASGSSARTPCASARCGRRCTAASTSRAGACSRAAISAHRHRALRHRRQGAGRAGLSAPGRQAARLRALLRHHRACDGRRLIEDAQLLLDQRLERHPHRHRPPGDGRPALFEPRESIAADRRTG